MSPGEKSSRRRRPSRRHEALWCGPPASPQRGLSRRGAVSAPAWDGRTNGKTLRCHRCLYEKPVAKKGQCCARRDAFLCGRAEPAPPRGGLSKLRRPCGGRPGDDAKGDFLGGARSPRPDCNALLMPRHFITLGGWPGGRGLMETCLGQAGAFLAGVRRPPLRRIGHRSWDGLAGKAAG